MSQESESILASMPAFHGRVLNAARLIREAMMGHRFLASLADGSLPDQAFKTWIVQDYLFVREEIAFLGVLVAKAPPSLRPSLADGMGALVREMELFRAQAEGHGVSVEGAEMAPTCHAYVQFLMATAYGRSFAEAFTVLYGVEKAYLDSWRWVKSHQRSASPWQSFIDHWSSAAFQEYVGGLVSTLDRLARGKSEVELAMMEDMFLLTGRYEYLFWDMAASGESWPV
jgi:thiaminase/transcriptional activator TenA